MLWCDYENLWFHFYDTHFKFKFSLITNYYTDDIQKFFTQVYNLIIPVSLSYSYIIISTETHHKTWAVWSPVL